jgi:hypothetical protein
MSIETVHQSMLRQSLASWHNHARSELADAFAFKQQQPVLCAAAAAARPGLLALPWRATLDSSRDAIVLAVAVFTC